MEYIDVIIQNGHIQACHRIGKSDKKTSSKKTIVRFVNRKSCNKALINRRELININSEAKYNFSKNNGSIAFCGKKLKRNGEIHSCYTKDGINHIKKIEHSKALKVHF